MKKCTIEGSLTIEASLIMVCVITCILVGIYYCLYLHDKTVLETEARRIALAAASSLTDNQSIDTGELDWQMYIDKSLLWRVLGAPDKTAELEKCALDRIDGELLACNNAMIDVSVSKTTVRVSYSANVKLSAFGFFDGYSTVHCISGEVTKKCFEQEELIRLIRGVIGDGEDNKSKGNEG